MEEVTLSDLAKEIGVTKSAINQKLNQEDKEKYLTKIGNKYIVNDEGITAIKSMFKGRKKSHINSNKNDKDNAKILESLTESIKADKEQLKEKDKQIEQLQKLLDQQQQLHQQANQRIEKLEAQLALEAPKENKESQTSPEFELQSEKLKRKEKEIQKLKDDVAKLEQANEKWYEQEQERKKQENAKKWFQFWK